MLGIFLFFSKRMIWCKKKEKMKLYITRNSATRLLFGGLSDVFVWFAKPTYLAPHKITEEENPFPTNPKERSFSGGFWQVQLPGRIERKSFSFGGVFGYGTEKDTVANNLASYVWNELEKHFGTPDTELWAQREYEGVAKIQDFLLEIDITISFDKP